MKGSPHVRESRIVLDSGLHAVDSGFQVLDSCLFLWNLDSRFESFIVAFRIPKPMIQDSASKIFPDSGIQMPLHVAVKEQRILLPYKTL